jgi:predicted site-specific integrase-resolvase
MFVTRAELIKRLRISSSGLHRAINDGRISKPIKVLGRSLWRKKEIKRILRGTTSGNNRQQRLLV